MSVLISKPIMSKHLYIFNIWTKGSSFILSYFHHISTKLDVQHGGADQQYLSARLKRYRTCLVIDTEPFCFMSIMFAFCRSPTNEKVGGSTAVSSRLHATYPWHWCSLMHPSCVNVRKNMGEACCVKVFECSCRVEKRYIRTRPFPDKERRFEGVSVARLPSRRFNLVLSF